ncbi:hypothetical protein H8A99_00905 [Bradyrhizobium sp. Arg68]|nr:hypothetical protein [Bradyrhizobium ivorense]
MLVCGSCGAAAQGAQGAAAPPSSEPTWEDCQAAVGEARTLTAQLPPDHLSRYFADRHLHQAMVEAGNGEFDECLEMAARASQEVRDRRHELPPGEKLRVLRADE